MKEGEKMSIVISLASARVNAELTQKQVCEELNISKTTLVNYEKGRTTPDIETGKKLSKLYGIPINNIKFF